MIKNLGQVCLFSSLITIPGQQCVLGQFGSVGQAFLISFTVVIYWGMSGISKREVKKGRDQIKTKGIRLVCPLYMVFVLALHLF